MLEEELLQTSCAAVGLSLTDVSLNASTAEAHGALLPDAAVDRLNFRARVLTYDRVDAGPDYKFNLFALFQGRKSDKIK